MPGIVGLGEASRLCRENLEEEGRRLAGLRDFLENFLLEKVEGSRRNGAAEHRLPHTFNLMIPGVDAETLIVNLPELVLSTGSACTSGAIEPSPVLMALGMERQDAYCSFRVGLGRGTTRKKSSGR